MQQLITLCNCICAQGVDILWSQVDMDHTHAIQYRLMMSTGSVMAGIRRIWGSTDIFVWAQGEDDGDKCGDTVGQ